MDKPTYRDIIEQHNGKVTDKWTAYFDEYDYLFTQLRDQAVKILEIGVMNGGSLEVLGKYFDKADTIWGVDIDPKVATLNFDDPRITVRVGDATSEKIVAKFGNSDASLDIVIDDGSHMNRHVIQSFLIFFPRLQENGIYLVEDTHCSYYSSHYGQAFAPDSMMAFFHRLTDIINAEHWGDGLSPQDAVASFLAQYGLTALDVSWINQIKRITFSNSLIAIHKCAPGMNGLGKRVVRGDSATVNATSLVEDGIAYTRKKLSGHRPDRHSGFLRPEVLFKKLNETVTQGTKIQSNKLIPSIHRDQLAHHEPDFIAHISAFVHRPSFAIVIDARNSSTAVAQTVQSLNHQLYASDHVMILCNADDNFPGIETTTRMDQTFFENLRQDYIAILTPGDILQRTATYHVAAAINRSDAPVDLFYCDEERPDCPFFKPAWSPDYLESYNFVGRSGFYRRDALTQAKISYDDLYDFVLRFTESDRNIVHIPKTLLTTPETEETVAQNHDANIRSLNARLVRTGRTGTVFAVTPQQPVYRHKLTRKASPQVSCIIPTAGKIVDVNGQKIDLITNVVGALRDRTDYKDLDIVVIDNDDLSDDQKQTLKFFDCTRVSFSDPAFNYSKKVNLGSTRARGDYLMLMNDDIDVIHPDWIDRMMDQTLKPGVGIVGPLLLFPDHITMQHAGVVVNNGIPVCVGHSEPCDDSGYFGSFASVKNFMAVVGACTLTSAENWRKVGGYSEDLVVHFNDVDYCLKLSSLGLRTIWTPAARLIHMESASLAPLPGGTVPLDLKSRNLFTNKWAPQIARDPYYNERFLGTYPSTSPIYVPRLNKRTL